LIGGSDEAFIYNNLIFRIYDDGVQQAAFAHAIGQIGNIAQVAPGSVAYPDFAER